jgi:DtxR family manganese transport transcriptional regulator
LVTAQPYRSIFLTDAGRKLADDSRRRHAVVLAFLKALGVPEAAAQSDAEGIEHHVSKETLAAFSRHLRFAG